VGQDLTIAQDPWSDETQVPRDRVAAQRVAPRIVRPNIDEDWARPAVAAPPRGAFTVVDVSWSAVAVDAEEVVATLHAERLASRGGFGHPHAVSDCPFCRRAAATYR
jgi:hypothetical protein